MIQYIFILDFLLFSSRIYLFAGLALLQLQSSYLVLSTAEEAINMLLDGGISHNPIRFSKTDIDSNTDCMINN
uniref:Uncharacterized protein n=1 Tax=Oryza brachyantha TaxID=4533 RepID=J3MZG5_ORYBR